MRHAPPPAWARPIAAAAAVAPIAPAEVDDVDEWAAAIAAALPPLTATEAAAVGRLAAELDSRRAGLLAPVARPSHTSPRVPTRRAA